MGFFTILLLTLICWYLLLPVVNSISLPLASSHGIISYLAINDRSPATNIIIYLLLFLLPSLAIIFLSYAQTHHQAFFRSSFSITAKDYGLKLIHHKRFLPILLLLFIVTWIITAIPIDGDSAKHIAEEGFHFGEKIGLSKTFLENPRGFFKDAYVLIHGFSLNVFPGIVGLLIGGSDHDISFSVLAFYTQLIASAILSFLVLLEIATFISPENRWKIFSLFCLVYFALYGVVLGFIDRDALFLAQVLLTLRWIRVSQTVDSQLNNTSKRISKSFFYPIIIGASLPISLFYVYDRAVYFFVVFVCLLSYLFLTTSKLYFIRSTIVSLSSALLAAIFISLLFGFDAIPTAISQISYWSKISGIFTGLPYPEIEVSIKALLNWLPIILQSLSLTLLCLQFRNDCALNRKKIQAFLVEQSFPLFMLLFAVLYMRVALGRSDEGHILNAGFFSIFAFATVLGIYITKYRLLQFSWFHTLIAFTAISMLVNMNSVTAAINFKGILNYPASIHAVVAQDNAALLPNYVEVQQKMQAEVDQQSCFYTLTSQGTWYRLFSKDPCSKYWYLIYAATPETQQELINDLERTKPNLVLYSSASLGNQIDGVLKETSHLLVHQYIWQHYRPYKAISDCWFWKRREVDVELSQLLVETPAIAQSYFDAFSEEATDSLDVTATGWIFQNDGRAPQERLVLLTFNPIGEPQEVSMLGLSIVSGERLDVAKSLNNIDALYSGWTVTFNRLNLPDRPVRIKAWAYEPADQLFHALTEGKKTLKPKS